MLVKILFRRWDLLEGWQITEADLKEKVRKPVIETGEIGWQEMGLTLKDLLQWNYGYFRRKINRSHGLALEEKREVGYYTDTVEEMGESILQAFFCGEQPMLNVVYYPFQERPSRKIEEWGYHLVFDEVGTGKTVSALYCIRNVVARKKEDARVLIICPGNKKGEWEKDIQRQLGLYAHKVSGTEDKIYSGDWKSLFFKAGEPAIFIEGQKAAEMKESLNTWKIRNERWDLIIIDEGHLCFDNYKNLRGAGDQGLLLTATPIVVNISLNSGIDDIRNVRKVKDYGQVLWEIVAGSGKWKKGEIPDTLFDPNDYVTQLFREDLNIEPKKRNIRFIKCKRLKDRDRYLDILKSVKGGLTQLVYEQDDEFLLYGIYDKFKDDIERKFSSRGVRDIKKTIAARGNNNNTCCCCGNKLTDLHLIITENENERTKADYPQIYEAVCKECRKILTEGLKKTELEEMPDGHSYEVVYECVVGNSHQIKPIKFRTKIYDGILKLCRR